MQQEILEWLSEQRVGVLSVEMLDGSPHAATVHFSHTSDPLEFFFETRRHYRKAEPILKNEDTRASFVVGFDESEMKTLQLDGKILLLEPENESISSSYLDKFTEKRGSENNPETIFFIFVPTWWRFTDWNKPEGKTIFTSDGKVEIVK